jgi:hypothetical protein
MLIDPLQVGSIVSPGLFTSRVVVRGLQRFALQATHDNPTCEKP